MTDIEAAGLATADRTAPDERREDRSHITFFEGLLTALVLSAALWGMAWVALS